MTIASSILPAVSLSALFSLPAGRTVYLFTNHLICIILSSIAQAVFGGESKFLPALREATGPAIARAGGRRGADRMRDAPASIEGQDGAGDLAGLHRAEGFVDVAEPAALGDHVVEVEPALAVEFEIGRDVVAEAVGAHPRGLDLALRTDRHPRELDHCVRRQDADD